MKIIKNEPIKSLIFKIQHLSPIKIMDKPTTKEQKTYKISRSFSKKIKDSPFFNNTRLRNFKSKYSTNRQNNLQNFRQEQLSEYQQLLENICQHTSNLNSIIKGQKYTYHNQKSKNSNREYNIFLQKPRRAFICKNKSFEIKPSYQKNIFYTNRQQFSKNITNKQARRQKCDDDMIKQKNKQLEFLENEESLNDLDLYFENLSTDNTYRINKINMIDYQKIQKGNPDYEKSIGKFYKFCNQRKKNIKFNLGNNQKPKLKQHHNPTQKSQLSSKKQFQPYHQQKIQKLAYLSPSITSKNQIINKKVQEEHNKIKIIKNYATILRKKESLKLSRCQIAHEDFILDGWKEV